MYGKLAHSLQRIRRKDMKLSDFKVPVAKSLIGSYDSSQRNAPPIRISRSAILSADAPLHLPIIQSTRNKDKCFYVGGLKIKRRSNVTQEKVSLLSGLTCIGYTLYTFMLQRQ